MADAEVAGEGAGAGAALDAGSEGVAAGISVYGTLCGAKKRGPFWPHPLAKAAATARKMAPNRFATLAPKISVEKIITGL